VQYLSEFEVLSEPIVPKNVPGLPANAQIPFVAQGWFLLLSRLADDNPGPLHVKLIFMASGPLPVGKTTNNPNQDDEANSFILIDYETGDDQTTNLPKEVLVPSFTAEPTHGANAVSVTIPIGSGGTVLIGVQPNVANADADGPLASGNFGWRGYVLIDTATDPNSPGGTFQLAATPEIRATFLVANAQGVPAQGFNGATHVAYALPTANGPLITLSKAKEAKDKAEKEKEASKDSKDIKDKPHPEKPHHLDKISQLDLPQVKEFAGDPAALAALSRRLAALEALIATNKPMIAADERPQVG
jgi:hypothetical protein